MIIFTSEELVNIFYIKEWWSWIIKIWTSV